MLKRKNWRRRDWYAEDSPPFNHADGMHSRKRPRIEDWDALEPSPVLHVRDLPEHTLEMDLVRNFERFGRVREVSMMPNRGQALVEFIDINDAKNLVGRAKTEFFNISNRPVKVNFSTSQRIVHKTDGLEASGDNRVLLCTVYNAQHPITVDVINQICNVHGRVLRIVIFKKYNIQAMVEFERIEDARTAKMHLNGADIYSGCCTCKVEFARPTRLTVTKNDDESWDFEAPPMSVSAPPTGNSLLGSPGRAGMSSGMGLRSPDDYGRGRGPAYDLPGGGYTNGDRMEYMDTGGQGRTSSLLPSRGGGASHRFNPYVSGSEMMSNQGGGGGGGCVLMVYGLNGDKMNCDRLFNILCPYGNVRRIKFLKTKEGAAMVEMGEPESCQRVMHNLHHSLLFGSKLQFQPSKQPVLLEVNSPFELNDGSPSYKDFSSSRNNRYTNPTMAAKNRVFPPSRTLHFWNVPPSYNEDDIMALFERFGDMTSPDKALCFPTRERFVSGLIEWPREHSALDALAVANHAEIKIDGAKYPYLIKLSFSESAIRDAPSMASDGDGVGGSGGGGGRRMNYR